MKTHAQCRTCMINLTNQRRSFLTAQASCHAALSRCFFFLINDHMVEFPILQWMSRRSQHGLSWCVMTRSGSLQVCALRGVVVLPPVGGTVALLLCHREPRIWNRSLCQLRPDAREFIACNSLSEDYRGEHPLREPLVSSPKKDPTRVRLF